MKTSIIIFVLTLFFVFQSSGVMAAQKMKKMKTNDPAPQFEATDFEGKVFDLNKTLKEAPIVLVFLRGFS